MAFTLNYKINGNDNSIDIPVQANDTSFLDDKITEEQDASKIESYKKIKEYCLGIAWVTGGGLGDIDHPEEIISAIIDLLQDEVNSLGLSPEEKEALEDKVVEFAQVSYGNQTDKYRSPKYQNQAPGVPHDSASTNYQHLNGNIETITARNIERIKRTAAMEIGREYDALISGLQSIKEDINELADLEDKISKERDPGYKETLEGRKKEVINRIENRFNDLLSNPKLKNILGDGFIDFANKVWNDLDNYKKGSKALTDINNEIDDRIKDAEEQKKQKEAEHQQSFVRRIEEALAAIDEGYAQGIDPSILNRQLESIAALQFDNPVYQDLFDRTYHAYVASHENLQKLGEIGAIQSGQLGGDGPGPGPGPGPEPEPDPIPVPNPEEPTPEIPDIQRNDPKLSWRTFAALALGIAAGVSAVVFLPSGIGVGVAVVGGGLLKAFAGRRRNKLKAKRLELVGAFDKANQAIQQAQKRIQEIDEMLAILNSSLANLSGPEKEQTEAKIAALTAEKEQLTAAIQQATEIQKQSAEQLKVNQVVEADGFVKGAGKRFASYFKSEEFMRDLQWLGNGAIFSAIAANMLGWGGIGIKPSTPDPVVDTTIGGDTPQPQPSGHHIGDSVDDLNLTHGHDSAEWAINGTNKEHLIQGVMHDGNSVFQGAYIQNPTTGVYELYTGPLSMEELTAKYGSRVAFRIGDAISGIGRSFSNAAELGLDAAKIGGAVI